MSGTALASQAAGCVQWDLAYLSPDGHHRPPLSVEKVGNSGNSEKNSLKISPTPSIQNKSLHTHTHGKCIYKSLYKCIYIYLQYLTSNIITDPSICTKAIHIHLCVYKYMLYNIHSMYWDLKWKTNEKDRWCTQHLHPLQNHTPARHWTTLAPGWARLETW